MLREREKPSSEYLLLLVPGCLVWVSAAKPNKDKDLVCITMYSNEALSETPELQ